MKEFADTREIVERIKDIISNNVDGYVYDYMVADVLGVRYSALRFSISKNTIPDLKKIARFCYAKNITINSIIF